MSDYDELVATTLAERPEVEAILTRRAQRARIASALRALRGRRGLSQRQLAAKTGWAQSFIARLESIADDQMPAPETIVRYAEACGAKVGLILLDEEGEGYRVGDVVALTDDPAATKHLAGLTEETTDEVAAGTAGRMGGETDQVDGWEVVEEAERVAALVVKEAERVAHLMGGVEAERMTAAAARAAERMTAAAAHMAERMTTETLEIAWVFEEAGRVVRLVFEEARRVAERVVGETPEQLSGEAKYASEQIVARAWRAAARIIELAERLAAELRAGKATRRVAKRALPASKEDSKSRQRIRRAAG